MKTKATKSAATQAKPPTQGVGVKGIDGFTTEREKPAEHIDWQFLASLPPFQMFALEITPSAKDGHVAANEFIDAQVQKVGEPALLEQYINWHEVKGYWPNETPFGQLKDIKL